MPNLGRGRGGVRKRIAPNLSQRRTSVSTPQRPFTPLPSQYNFTPSSQPPVTQMPQPPVTPKPQPPVTQKPQPQPHFRDFPPPLQLFQNSTPQTREIGSSSSPLQFQNSHSPPLHHSPAPPLQHSPASPHHHSQGQSNQSSEAHNFDGEDDELPPLDPVLDDDLQHLLDSLLTVPGREEFTTVLSPTPKPNTLWLLRDKGSLVRKITKVFTNKFDGPYYSWTVVPPRRQQRYFIEFAKTHTWDPYNKDIGEVFIRTHTKSDGTFVDLKAKNIAETYENNVKAKLSELEAKNSGTLNGDPQPRELSP